MRLAGLLLVVIIVMGGIGYWYYNDTQTRLAVLTENNAKLESAIALSEETISSLETSYEESRIENQRLNTAYADIRRQNDRLSDKLSNVDLGLLAAEKPALIERAINTGTKNAARCFELLSGAELSDVERNAENGEQFNKECPWLWTGSITSGMSGE